MHFNKKRKEICSFVQANRDPVYTRILCCIYFIFILANYCVQKSSELYQFLRNVLFLYFQTDEKGNSSLPDYVPTPFKHFGCFCYSNVNILMNLSRSTGL